MLSDHNTTLAIMDELTGRAQQALSDAGLLDDLPHPAQTSASLDHHLTTATAAGQHLRRTATGPRGTVDPVVGVQARFNEATIHCLHQFDHRSRVQERRITDLESVLAETQRRLATLEARQG